VLQLAVTAVVVVVMATAAGTVLLEPELHLLLPLL
jgi:hypothetical protein